MSNPMSIDRMGTDGGRWREPAPALESGPEGVMGAVTAPPGTGAGVADAPGASRAG